MVRGKVQHILPEVRQGQGQNPDGPLVVRQQTSSRICGHRSHGHPAAEPLMPMIAPGGVSRSTEGGKIQPPRKKIHAPMFCFSSLAAHEDNSMKYKQIELCCDLGGQMILLIAQLLKKETVAN